MAPPRKSTHQSKPIGRGAQRVPKKKFRESILNAALEVFSERGFHESQMSEIAQRAQVAVGTVYNLFNSKADLYRDLNLEHGVEMFAAFNELMEGDQDPLDKLIEYVRIKGEIFEENREMVKLFFAEGRGARLNVRALLKDDSLVRYDAVLQRVSETFEAAIALKLIEPMNAFDLAVALDSLTNSFIVLYMDHPEQHRYTDKIPTILRMFFGSVVTAGGRGRLELELA